MLHEEKKVLLSNFFALAILQGLNFLLPLVVVPYLLYTLGVEIFGFLAMATAFSSYFLILSEYGFNATATREVSVSRENPEKLNEIFSAVMQIKIMLMFLGAFILSLSLLLFDTLGKEWLIYSLTFGMVIGQVLFPIWFFQGIEKMGYISILNIVAKLFFLIAILFLVKEKEDAYLVPLLNSLGFILVGLLSLFYVYKTFHIRFIWQPYSVLKEYLVLGWHIFLSRIAVVFYTSSNVFILGLFTTHTMVGYYAIAEKVVVALGSLGDIINQVLFPFLAKKWQKNKEQYYRLFYKILISMILGMFFLALILIGLSENIVSLLSGERLEVSIELLRIMSVAVVFAPLGALFSQSFVTQQKNIYVTKSTFWTLFVNLLLVSILVTQYGVYGLAITVVLVKLFHFILNFSYFIRLRKEKPCVVS